ncbi:MAG: cation:proton antiporter [Candidatus Hydrogenedentota bacterium]
MRDETVHIHLLLMLVGGLVALSILIKPLCQRLGIPALVAFLAIGLGVRGADQAWPFFSDTGEEIFDFLAKLGIIVILFRTGMECDLRGLLKHLRGASFIWIGNMVVSAAAGYIATRYALGLATIPSLVVATAMTATSVGMTVPLWQQAGALDKDAGQQFVDVAELDDITGVVLMALLFAVLPILRDNGEGTLAATLAYEVGRFALAVVLFGAACLLFSIYAEQPVSRFVRRFEPKPNDMLVVAGIGIVIAAMAGLLGFSAAIGAFFAGLVFSGDPKRVDFDASFSAIYEMFAPFFFIGIGMTIAPDALTGAVSTGLVLLVAAVLGKVIGAGVFAIVPCPSLMCALTLGVSMVPRAEITMIIMHKGHNLGASVVPDTVFSGMVLVSALTCGITPFVLRPMIHRFTAGDAP